jgi:hypothetical protein
MSEDIPKKKIVIEFCDECPYEGECYAWKQLTRKQRFTITTGVGIPRFMLKECDLKDDIN